LSPFFPFLPFFAFFLLAFFLDVFLCFLPFVLPEADESLEELLDDDELELLELLDPSPPPPPPPTAAPLELATIPLELGPGSSTSMMAGMLSLSAPFCCLFETGIFAVAIDLRVSPFFPVFPTVKIRKR